MCKYQQRNHEYFRPCPFPAATPWIHGAPPTFEGPLDDPFYTLDNDRVSLRRERAAGGATSPLWKPRGGGYTLAGARRPLRRGTRGPPPDEVGGRAGWRRGGNEKEAEDTLRQDVKLLS